MQPESFVRELKQKLRDNRDAARVSNWESIAVLIPTPAEIATRALLAKVSES